MMKTIEFSHEAGEAFGDYEAASKAREFLQHPTSMYLCTKTENIVLTTRVLIHDRLFPSDQVQFVFRGEVVPHTADGRFERWPVGFCGFWDDCLDVILSPVPDRPGSL